MMDTPKNDRTTMLGVFVAFLVLVYGGLYWVLNQANWIGVSSISNGPITTTMPAPKWIEAHEKVPWVNVVFYPAMRIDEFMRGYSGKPQELDDRRLE